MSKKQVVPVNHAQPACCHLKHHAAKPNDNIPITKVADAVLPLVAAQDQRIAQRSDQSVAHTVYCAAGKNDIKRMQEKRQRTADDEHRHGNKCQRTVADPRSNHIAGQQNERQRHKRRQRRDQQHLAVWLEWKGIDQRVH